MLSRNGQHATELKPGGGERNVSSLGISEIINTIKLNNLGYVQILEMQYVLYHQHQFNSSLK